MGDTLNTDNGLFVLLHKIRKSTSIEEALRYAKKYVSDYLEITFFTYQFADIWLIFQNTELSYRLISDVDVANLPLSGCSQREFKKTKLNILFPEGTQEEQEDSIFSIVDAICSVFINQFDLITGDAILGDTLNKLPAQVYRIVREKDQYKLSFCSGMLFDSGVAHGGAIGLGLRNYMRNQTFTFVYQYIARAFMGETVEFELTHSKSWYHHTVNVFRYDDSGYIVEVIGFAQDITDRHLAQHQLELREAELSQAQEIAKIGNWYWNKEGNFIEWTKSIDRIFGLPSDRRPKSLADFHRLFEERSRKRIAKAHQLISNRGGMYEEEVMFRREDSQQRMLLVNGKAILNDQKKVLGISGTVRDITDLKTIEENLRISERRLNAAIRGGNTGIWEKNINSDVVFFNALSKEILAIHTHENELQIADFIQNVHPQDQERLANIVSNDNEESFSFTFRYYKNGTLRYIEMSASLYNARFVEKAKFIGILTDITERKLNEIKIKEINAQLKGILDNSSSAIFIKDASGLILLMNKMGKKWWAISPDEDTYADDILTEEAVMKSKAADEQVLLRKCSYTYEINTVVDKRELNLLMTKFPIEYDDGQLYIGGIATDITQLKESERELILAKEKAEESDRLKSAFLANMSHEIRTPLNSIIGFSDLLKKRKLDSQERNRFLNIINEQGRHLLSIVNDIIDLSAIESNQLKLQFAEVDINKSLEGLRMNFEEEVRELDQKNIEIVFSSPEGLSPLVMVDLVRVNQVLKNLIGNAIKFTERGFIRFGYELANDRMNFFVQDTGSGIAEEHLETVFKRFRQVDQSDTRKHGGTGLGLAISKALVELMGGEIKVMSIIGQGTTFEFWTPTSWKAKEAPVAEESGELIIPDWKERKIVIVEDDPGSAFLLKTMLKETNATIEHFVFGKDVIKYCENTSDVDLILMDLQLPDISGYECTEAIKKTKPNIRIVAQSAQVMRKDRERAFQSGCDGFIPKPLNLRSVLVTIDEVLG